MGIFYMPMRALSASGCSNKGFIVFGRLVKGFDLEGISPSSRLEIKPKTCV